MTRKAFSTTGAPKPVAAYSVGMEAAGLVFTAGQGGHHPKTGELPDGIAAQTRQALENVEAILRAGNSSLASAVKISIFLADRADYAAMNEAYREYMPDDPPVRTTVQAGLGGGMLVEIDAIAVVAGSKT
jgi:2-iminobutanoate/2-iminopropanoate deaminase